MIKKLSIFAVMAFATATPAKAAELTQNEIDVCEIAGATAEVIMTERQLGSSPVEVRKEIRKVLVENKMLRLMDLVDLYLIEAYKLQQHAIEELQSWSIAGFRNAKEAECLRHFIEQGDEA